ncbi:helix-turn-helix domain-containing protein [Nocardia sp. NPDC020380]|uniref:helix-turn-helix domain-containing protein n=1 Tax=Nocardia sp. NPDC020380 TaxID=3364309 RepID=UPI0037BC4F2C
MTIEVPKVLTVAEVADILRVHRQTVNALINSGDLPAFKAGRVYRVNAPDLAEYMNGGK